MNVSKNPHFICWNSCLHIKELNKVSLRNKFQFSQEKNIYFLQYSIFALVIFTVYRPVHKKVFDIDLLEVFKGHKVIGADCERKITLIKVVQLLVTDNSLTK